MKKLIANMIQRFWTFLGKRQCAECGTDLKINRKSRLSSKTFLGNHVNMNGMMIQGSGEVHIGDYFHSGTENMIITSNHAYDTGNKIPYDETNISKDVVIEDFVWLGNRVLILPGVHIHEGAIIQAGAVVTKDIPYCAIAGGNPAVVFKYRDIEHFEKLKESGQFH